MVMKELSKTLFDFECEISGEDFALECKDDFNDIKTLKDVKEYYLVERGWDGDDSLEDLLMDFIISLK